MDLKNARASSPFLAGKKGVEWETMSVCTRRGVSASWKRMAKPRGLPFESVSGITGIPVELENRATTGVALLKCWAFERDLAFSVGVKVPLRRIPFACAVLC
jgi:hypothetical protein